MENALEGINRSPEEREASTEVLFAYLLEQVRDHIDNPRDDLTTYLINA